MKKVIAGCIDLMLEFDSASELDRYIADIEAKKQEYSIVDRKELLRFIFLLRMALLCLIPVTTRFLYSEGRMASCKGYYL